MPNIKTESILYKSGYSMQTLLKASSLCLLVMLITTISAEAQSRRSRLSQLEFDRDKKKTETKSEDPSSPLEKSLLQVVNAQQQSQAIKQAEQSRPGLLSKEDLEERRDSQKYR
ncbi:MAG TPA: hypothetical protein PKA63_06100 [Oligoflexia bacterium]|nr:hypothetical protein [Oligoflexia bacterium]HMP48222.1 hypothetical protein [Oligoflexia bacterium]